MNQNRFVAPLVLAALCLFIGASVCAAQSAPPGLATGTGQRMDLRALTPAIRPTNNELAARGFDELYNGDYDPAIRDFTQLRSQYPDDPFPANYLLAAELFKELYRICALDTETYSSESFLTSRARRPLDMAAQKRIFELIARVESLCNARLQKNPNDTDALYARGVARGFRRTYMGMAGSAWVR